MVHAFFLDGVQQLRREVQTCRWRRGGAGVGRIDRIVAVFVFELVGDVRRQRHLSQPVKDFLKDPVKFKLDQAVTLINDIHDLAYQKAVAELDPCFPVLPCGRVLRGFPRRRRSFF